MGSTSCMTPSSVQPELVSISNMKVLMQQQQCNTNSRQMQPTPSSKIQFPLHLKKCFGVIKTIKTKYSDRERNLGVAIVLGSNMVISTKANTFYKQEELRFIAQWQQKQCEIKHIASKGYSERRGWRKNSPNIYVLILKQHLTEWQTCPLMYSFPMNVNAYLPIIQDNCLNKFEPNFVKIQPKLLEEQKHMINIGFFEDKSNEGAPITILYQGNWYIIGIKHGFNKRRKCTTAKVFTSIDIGQIIDLSRQYKMFDLKIFQFDKMRVHSMEDYIKDRWRIAEQQYEKRKQIQFEQRRYMTDQDWQRNRIQHWGGGLSKEVFRRSDHDMIVNGVLLSYPDYKDRQGTIEKLNRQYFEETERNLVLQTPNFTIPLELPVSQAFYSVENRENFEDLLNSLITEDQNMMQDITEGYLEDLQQRIRHFQPRLENKGKECLIKIRGRKEYFIVDGVYVNFEQVITINQAINYVKDQFRYSFRKFEIYTNEEKRLLNDYNERLKDVQNHELTIVFQDIEKYISIYSEVMERRNGLGTIDYVRQDFDSNNLLSYNEKENKITYESIDRCNKNEEVYLFLRIQYQHHNLKDHLDCTFDTLIKLSDKSWIMAKDIKQGERLMGVSDYDIPQIVEYTVTKIKAIKNDEKIEFFNVQVNYTYVCGQSLDYPQ